MVGSLQRLSVVVFVFFLLSFILLQISALVVHSFNFIKCCSLYVVPRSLSVLHILPFWYVNCYFMAEEFPLGVLCFITFSSFAFILVASDHWWWLRLYFFSNAYIQCNGWWQLGFKIVMIWYTVHCTRFKSLQLHSSFRSAQLMQFSYRFAICNSTQNRRSTSIRIVRVHFIPWIWLVFLSFSAIFEFRFESLRNPPPVYITIIIHISIVWVFKMHEWSWNVAVLQTDTYTISKNWVYKNSVHAFPTATTTTHHNRAQTHIHTNLHTKNAMPMIKWIYCLFSLSLSAFGCQHSVLNALYSTSRHTIWLNSW